MQENGKDKSYEKRPVPQARVSIKGERYEEAYRSRREHMQKRRAQKTQIAVYDSHENVSVGKRIKERLAGLWREVDAAAT